MTFGVILPHTKVYGGVKRFFEIGNELVRKDHSFLIFTPEGLAPDCFPFLGEVKPLRVLMEDAIDVLFITEPEYIQNLVDANVPVKIFYAILQRASIRRAVKRFPFFVFANSKRLYNYLGNLPDQRLVYAPGGIDSDRFSFNFRKYNSTEPFVVLAYGRFYRRKKGTLLVVRACERLYQSGLNIRLLLFDSPQEESDRIRIASFTCRVPFEFIVDYPAGNLQDIYHRAHAFVSAERNAGWSNTSAEAMACGVPVIATRSGTEDFLIHKETGIEIWRHSWFIGRAIRQLMKNEELRERLSRNARDKIAGYSWRSLADRIEQFAFRQIRQ